ncbi:MAG: HAD hydrolase family protein [Chitinophagales bacterium]|jgi:YrbI family 3-deoxy-D-manno-octulosonate 8-phosphate phosphatase|nr:HAD hydrolase family protein [Chitinophagales bacterium]
MTCRATKVLKNTKIKFFLLDIDGSLTDGGVYVDNNALQSKRFYAQDGEGIKILKSRGVKIGFITAAFAVKPLIESRAQLLEVDKVYCGKEAKLGIAQGWSKELNIQFDEMAYLGDDIFDIELLQAVGIACIPANANKALFPYAALISSQIGGHGAFRSIVDYLVDHELC